MTTEEILILLESVRSGEAPVEHAAALLGAARGYREIDGAVVDTDRLRRTGYPEVIYCASKTPAQISSIVRALLDAHGLAFGTRCAPEAAEEVIGDASVIGSLTRALHGDEPESGSPDIYMVREEGAERFYAVGTLPLETSSAIRAVAEPAAWRVALAIREEGATPTAPVPRSRPSSASKRRHHSSSSQRQGWAGSLEATPSSRSTSPSG